MVVSVPAYWAAFARPAYRVQAFQGTLLTDKADATGTIFRRNRHYDPVSARFTQEDPIGLAGGLNLYGFAGGDPVNFGDPFGLAPCPPDNDCDALTAALAATGTLLGGLGGGMFGGAAGAFCGPGAPACSTAGAVAFSAKGAAAGAAAGLSLGVLFSRQSDAVNRSEGLRGTTDEHLGKIRGNPASRDVGGWRKEVNAHLREIERLADRMGRKTAEQWRDYARQAREQLDQLTKK